MSKKRKIVGVVSCIFIVAGFVALFIALHISCILWTPGTPLSDDLQNVVLVCHLVWIFCFACGIAVESIAD